MPITKKEEELLKKNPYVTVAFCNERFNRIMGKLNIIEKKMDNVRIDKKERGKELRVFAYSMVGSIVSGVMVAMFVILASL